MKRTLADKIDFARQMHEKPTRLEMLFDRMLRKVVQGRVTIKPQFVLHGYIADFYLPDLALVLEVDGPRHEDPKQRHYDFNRDAVLARNGIRTKRFTYRDLQCPMAEIQNKIGTVLNAAKRSMPNI